VLRGQFYYLFIDCVAACCISRALYSCQYVVFLL